MPSPLLSIIHPPIAVHPPLAAAQPQHLAMTLLRPDGMATINPALLHWTNPVLHPPVQAGGQARQSFDLPTLVAPTASPDNATVFEAPKDASKRYYLPHYVIATAPGAGAQAQFVSLDSDGDGCRLAVHLADATPASLAAGNAPAPGAARYLISASLQGRAVTWELSPAAPEQSTVLALSLAIPDFAGRNLLYAAMTDPGAEARLIVRREVALALPATPPQQGYIAAVRAIDAAIPFTFSKDLDANIFAGLRGASARLPGWNVCAVAWNGRAHTYYQSASQPEQVYFLPDAFKVGRLPAPSRRPALSAAAAGADMASLQMTLSYLAAPEWDTARIAAAATDLQRTLALAAPPQLALFQATSTALLLNLPGADPAMGETLTEQKGVVIDLAAGVQGAATMGLPQFRQVYNALFDERSALLSGQVRVTVGTDVAAIPFVARIADMTGDIFDIETKIDAPNGRVIVTLTNAIESPVQVQAISGAILKGGKTIASAIATDPAMPASLAPATATQQAGALSVTVSASTEQAIVDVVGGLLGNLIGGGKITGQQVEGAISGVAGQLIDDTCTAQLDLSHVSVVPDAKALWQAIMSDQGAAPVSRSVQLKFIAAALARPAASPGTPSPDALVAVQVVFDSGQTADFDAGQPPDAAGFLTRVVALAAPLESFVLGNAPIDVYRYRIDQISAAGIKQGAWVSDNRDTLYVVPG